MSDPPPEEDPAPFIHPAGLCESSHVGSGTRIWAFAHVLGGATVGRDCNLCDHVFVENDVVVGDRVTVKCGVQLWDGVRLGDDVFVGPNATFTNDRFPRSRRPPEAFAHTVVEAGASIGANATILPGIRIGARAMVGAGSVVVGDVPPDTVVVGNPARIVSSPPDGSDDPAPTRPTGPGDARLIDLTFAEDLRGKLVAGEVGRELPFVPQRAFAVFGVPSAEVRGAHAHRQCSQLLIALAGSVSVRVDDGHAQSEYSLADPRSALLLPARLWAVQHRFSPGAVLLVLASNAYDASDYVRDHAEFLTLVRRGW